MSTKLLMCGGVQTATQNNSAMAEYWASLGLQGFLLLYVVTSWSTDVGVTPNSGWNNLRTFQSLYAQHGMADNFIKVSAFTAFDWTSKTAANEVVAHFNHAAGMARYAGVPGIAIDLEPYWASLWQASSGGTPALAQSLGRRIGAAMLAAYPKVQLFLLPDVIWQAANAGTAAKYVLAPPFVHGLLSVAWASPVLGTEQTYSQSPLSIVHTMAQLPDEYGFSKSPVGYCPGVWPLGPTSTDKSPRMPAAQFSANLTQMYQLNPPYVFIYASNGAWQTNSPYGAGPVCPEFQSYVDVIHQVRAKFGQ